MNKQHFSDRNIDYNVLATWHLIQMYKADVSYPIFVEWLNENINGKWYVPPGSSGYWSFYFSDKEDEILVKLRWM